MKELTAKELMEALLNKTTVRGCIKPGCNCKEKLQEFKEFVTGEMEKDREETIQMCLDTMMKKFLVDCLAAYEGTTDKEFGSKEVKSKLIH